MVVVLAWPIEIPIAKISKIPFDLRRQQRIIGLAQDWFHVLQILFPNPGLDVLNSFGIDVYGINGPGIAHTPGGA